MKSDGVIDDDRVGDVSAFLVKILKEKSKIFASRIGIQVIQIMECYADLHINISDFFSSRLNYN